MRISQRAYFDVSSETVPAAAVTARLGMEPDQLKVRGATRAEPPVPSCHSWSVHCQEPGLRLDAQIGEILRRIEPVRQRLAGLVNGEEVSARLVIVRYFNDADGEEESFEAAVIEGGRLLEKLPGQHQLLGWYLTAQQLEFLGSINCSISADEYG